MELSQSVFMKFLMVAAGKRWEHFSPLGAGAVSPDLHIKPRLSASPLPPLVAEGGAIRLS